MTYRTSPFLVLALVALGGCGDDGGVSADASNATSTTADGATTGSETSTSEASSGGNGDGGAGAGGASEGGGGTAPACAPSIDADRLHLAVGAALEAGEERTMCLRWTAPEDIEIVGLQGTLGPAAGHHALVLVHPEPSGPDGASPCSEDELMDQNLEAGFQMIAGVSYESDGVHYPFPSAPVQLGLAVKAGQQLVLDAHFLNVSPDAVDACAEVDFDIGNVLVPLTFRTVLPEEQYDLVIPAHDEVEVAYDEPIGASYRVAAASSHMHQGGRQFRLSVVETDLTLYEGDDWSDPVPRQFDGAPVVIDGDDTFRVACTIANESNADRRFPEEMCVGGLYLVPCTFPGACP